jgi:predicted GNAT family acetyltransferase
MSDIQLDENAGRFSLVVDGQTCVLEFVREDDVVSMNSVRVPEAVGGRGIAGELTRFALDWARAEKLTVLPLCPYVSKWIKVHQEYRDLLA